jgi:hypothetical protein
MVLREVVPYCFYNTFINNINIFRICTSYTYYLLCTISFPEILVWLAITGILKILIFDYQIKNHSAN